MIHPRIAASVFNTPLLFHPDKAAAILMGIGARVTGRSIEVDGAVPVQHIAFAAGRPSMGTVGDRMGRAIERRGGKAYDMIGNVAVIPVEGSLVHKGSWLESDSGETSYEGIQTQVAAAARDPQVRGVAFEIDSYGGTASGAFETSDMIARLSEVKPTVALLTDVAASAGYLMASATRQIIIPEQGEAGSIGVVTVHTDMSGKLEQEGVKLTILTSGAHKADGNSAGPLPADVAARMQADIDALRQTFAGRVSRYRGKRMSFDKAMATEARMYRGAEAVQAGLADATGHAGEAFQAFVSMINRA